MAYERMCCTIFVLIAIVLIMCVVCMSNVKRYHKGETMRNIETIRNEWNY